MPRQSALRFTFAVVDRVDFEVIAFDFDEALSETFRLDVQLAHAGPAIPRIGQEVIVDFWDGDPDQPVITGRTYRSNQLPAYALPRHKTRMTIKSQTHKGEGYNELRFEDEKVV
ncbi:MULTISPECIES: hypothetical protein [unclassified Cupriavidus]|uniref:hypothetical protein n=1 Tax=unclassified Cupriavidus TaxID=2640874 RepID=UPI003F93809F